jgi:hypothetical protein
MDGEETVKENQIEKYSTNQMTWSSDPVGSSFTPLLAFCPQKLCMGDLTVPLSPTHIFP